MKEEIFGPIMPVLPFSSLNDVISKINDQPKPLALYFFSNNKEHHNKVIERIPFGGGCINDCLVHLSNPELPFGGVGTSGIGSYHGRHSFDCFSHKKSVLKNKFWFDPSIRYAPYKKKHLNLLRKLMG